MANMRENDESFFGYVLLHSATPRHAFHQDDARRLLELAGVSEMRVDDCGLRGFVGIGEAEANRLVELARDRLRRQKDITILANAAREGGVTTSGAVIVPPHLEAWAQKTLNGDLPKF